MTGLDARPCEHCGEQFAPVRSSHVYCSSSCSTAVQSRKRAERRMSVRLDTKLSCENCGDTFHPTHRLAQKYCSLRCKMVHDNRLRVLRRWHDVTDLTCRQCGDDFYPSSLFQKLCSRECAAKHKAQYHAAYHADPDRRRRQRESRIAEKAKLDRRCPHCGHRLDPGKRKDAAYCRRECMRKARVATNDARSRVVGDGAVERISRAYIIERDGGRCHICRKKCKPSEIHLDHLIPLSKGGTHTLENLRVAHAKCNIAKGARACNEQLMLVG